MKIEINENLNDPQYGIKNFDVFIKAIDRVGKFFYEHLGKELDNGPKLFIDNAPIASGWTPIIMPVFDEYLIMKLGIEGEENEAQVAFQFSHELMHYVYYAKYGLMRGLADEKEEAICVAASLCVLAEIYKESLDKCINFIRKEAIDSGYKAGEMLAQKLGYNFNRLIMEIEKVIDEI